MKNDKIIGLADCNSFYASCEKVFRPDLANSPVIVLSNNDGIVVALSDEAKRIGIKRGMALFKIKELVIKYNVAVFSSNYALYADFSSRVFKIIDSLVPEIEIYSIDEVFIDFKGVSDIDELSHRIKDTVLRSTGIPISIGIGKTKTLAKVANRIAKKYAKFNKVFNMTSESYSNSMQKILSTIEIGDIWGIGRKKSEMLRRYNINNAYDLTLADEKLIRKLLTVTGLRTQMELKGISCIYLEESPPPKQTIVSSISFGTPITEYFDLKSAVAGFVTRACEKLRKQNSSAKIIYVFIRTNRFSQAPQYSNGISINLPQASNITTEIIDYAIQGLKQIYQSGYKYSKGGVMLAGIEHSNMAQISLFQTEQREKQAKATFITDKLNQKMGRDTVHSAMYIKNSLCATKREYKSPYYTTRWAELPEVKAK
jgi:DNA polymerase V